jgi:alpha-N-arabinofuranosidase
METNGFGTHEFMSLCRKIGARPWLNVNMLTGSVTEMVEWAEYCNREAQTTLTQERAVNGSPEPFDVRFWGSATNLGPEAVFTQPKAMPPNTENTPRPSLFDKLTFGGDRTSPRPITLIAAGPDGNKPRERVEWTRRLFQASVISGHRASMLWICIFTTGTSASLPTR